MSFRSKLNGFKEIRHFDNRWWLTFTKVLFPLEQLNVYRYKGLEILVDHAAGDANGAREVLTSPMYQRFLPKMKLVGAVNVLDLGANNGGFPLLLKVNGVTMKKVVSVEFNPNTFTRLRFNLERNLQCETVALNAALCGDGRQITARLGGGSVSDSIYGDSVNGSGQVYLLPGRTFNDIYQSHFAGEIVDICKMDVEEAEFEVFAKPEHTDLRFCRYLIIEIHERGGRKAGEIIPTIESLGFSLRQPEQGADQSVHFFINKDLENH